MLMTGHRMLAVADEHRFAVPAFNISDWAMCQGIVAISERLAAPIIHTDPDGAAQFVERTGVDNLAIAIGTCHGIYPAWRKPELRLDLLADIKAKVAVPLVLHGG